MVNNSCDQASTPSIKFLSAIKASHCILSTHLKLGQNPVNIPTRETLTFHRKMARLAIALLFVVAIGYITADEDEDNSCAEPKDCPCGSVCNEGVCQQGCMLFDTFLTAGEEAEVYGRKCRCGDTADERGMLLECAEGVEFTGAPEGVAEWENNPTCEEPAPSEAAPAAI